MNKIKNSDVLSPTFNIVYDYNVGNLKILHYDLYRLKNYKDISQLGIFDNSDDHINVLDVIIVVNLILENSFNELGDMNEDGILNILDIIDLINLILD